MWLSHAKKPQRIWLFLRGFSKFKRNMEATGGFEPPNRGFADLRLKPLGYVAIRALFQAKYGAEGGTRTRTSLRTLRPQRSLSTNFSTPARVMAAADRISTINYRVVKIWQERRDSNPRPLVLETSALAS